MTHRTELKRPVKTVNSAFRVFEILKEHESLTLGELAAELGLAKSTVYRYLRTLEEGGYVVRNGDTYSLGLRFLEFAVFARDRRALWQLSRESIDYLAEQAGETVGLVALENDHAVHLYQARGNTMVRTSSSIGERQLLHQSASGKAILASLPDAEVHDIVDKYGLPARSQYSITDEERLFDELAQVREDGYAVSREESTEGMNAIGAAIHDRDGDPVGGVSIVGPAHRLKVDGDHDDFPELLLGTVNEIEVNFRNR